jgi:nitrate reductase assembly molybdenum cofactor insertion protein NarJ
LHTGYIRDRDEEFIKKGVAREELIIQLEELIVLINTTLNSFSDEDMQADYPMIFDDAKRSNTYVLMQLLVHLNYHLGQVNYLRRFFG